MRALTCILMLMLTTHASAQRIVPVPRDELATRRSVVYERIGDAVALVPSAERMPSYTAFRQSNRFYYLTGLEVWDSYLLLDGRTRRATLFVPAVDRFAAWEGPMHAGHDALVAASGVDEAVFARELERRLDERLGSGGTIWLPLEPEEIGPRINDSAKPAFGSRTRRPLEPFVPREETLKRTLVARFGDLTVKDLSPTLRRARAVKSAWEIGILKEASRISALAMKDVIRAARPGRYEYELGAIAGYKARLLGGQGDAYGAIVGSGPNSCLVHYWKKGRRLEDGDIVVVDAAAAYSYYVSDVTRTFPANGRFTPEQRKVYDAVLEAQLACIDACHPGVRLLTLNRIATTVLKKRGLGPHILHFVGHQVGMAVHDPGGIGRLQAGHVITIEPGAYLKDAAIGVRIEDVVVVTDDGCEVITADVPKKADEIEALMAGDKKM